ncbi:hypothetical protein BBK36DRAFT_1116584 [Trichoderma citrinoviride]|uniref:RRM domain-containing protein n=1 Tax=Trichoderma citrinoviride TaxID=58853 RepID=A0A2T4BEK1_9HYPO|nr:hypothetical protein BBK36DRAFT_1116584 [Trichoderma citrinoviride]PTB67736.1 hypothetical protein BBK36DRAFT_1116584 [Trichoderma citrinoviride]
MGTPSFHERNPGLASYHLLSSPESLNSATTADTPDDSLVDCPEVIAASAFAARASTAALSNFTHLPLNPYPSARMSESPVSASSGKGKGKAMQTPDSDVPRYVGHYAIGTRHHEIWGPGSHSRENSNAAAGDGTAIHFGWPTADTSMNQGSEPHGFENPISRLPYQAAKSKLPAFVDGQQKAAEQSFVHQAGTQTQMTAADVGQLHAQFSNMSIQQQDVPYSSNASFNGTNGHRPFHEPIPRGDNGDNVQPLGIEVIRLSPPAAHPAAPDAADAYLHAHGDLYAQKIARVNALRQAAAQTQPVGPPVGHQRHPNPVIPIAARYHHHRSMSLHTPLPSPAWNFHSGGPRQSRHQHQPPQGFLPMQAVMQQTPATAFTSPSSPDGSSSTRFSTRYRGMHADANASAEHLGPEENCALWLTNLPPTVTVHELLGAIRNVGRIWCTYINYPDFAVHQTAAAKVVFFTPEAAQQLLAISWTRGLFVSDYRVKVSHNRIKYGSHAVQGTKVSRCLIITGNADFVNPEELFKYFKGLFIFQLDEIIPLIRAGNRAVVEFRFGSYRCQAQMGKMSLEKNRQDGVEKVEFGDDPCEVGDTMSSYGIAAERIQGRGL